MISYGESVTYIILKYTKWLKPLVNYLAIRQSSLEKSNIDLYPISTGIQGLAFICSLFRSCLFKISFKVKWWVFEAFAPSGKPENCWLVFQISCPRLWLKKLFRSLLLGQSNLLIKMTNPNILSELKLLYINQVISRIRKDNLRVVKTAISSVLGFKHSWQLNH